MPHSGRDHLVHRARVAGVHDVRVLDALTLIGREGFVPPEHRAEAYLDEPIPTLAGQVTSQPSLIAKMVEALGLMGSERVLEVGTGFGFQTALLSVLAREVVTIDRIPEIAEAAARNLADAGLANVRVVVGDGSLGVPEHAPYDAIVVSAAFPTVPEPLAAQLAPGGRLVQPLGPGGKELVTVFVMGEHGLEPHARISAARFVRLYGENAYPDRGSSR